MAKKKNIGDAQGGDSRRDLRLDQNRRRSHRRRKSSISPTAKKAGSPKGGQQPRKPKEPPKPPPTTTETSKLKIVHSLARYVASGQARSAELGRFFLHLPF